MCVSERKTERGGGKERKEVGEEERRKREKREGRRRKRHTRKMLNYCRTYMYLPPTITHTVHC